MKFTPDQMKTWMDTRAYGNSPWSPPYNIPVPPADGRWTADVDVQRAGHLRAARRCERRLAVHLRKRHGHRHAVACRGDVNLVDELTRRAPVK